MESEAFREWKSLFTPKLEEIWKTERKELRKVTMILYVLKLEFTSLDSCFNSKLDDLREKFEENDFDKSPDLLSGKRYPLISSNYVNEQPVVISDEEKDLNKVNMNRAKRKIQTNLDKLLTPTSPKFKFNKDTKRTKIEDDIKIISPIKQCDLIDNSIIESTQIKQPSRKNNVFRISKLSLGHRNKENHKDVPVSLNIWEKKPDQSGQSSNTEDADITQLPDEMIHKDLLVDNDLLCSFIRNYDVIPEKNTKETFVHVPEVIRGKERKKLQGWSCKNCENYYKEMGLSPEELQEKMNKCSKHRNKFKPPSETPPRFWDLTMTLSEEEEL